MGSGGSQRKHNESEAPGNSQQTNPTEQLGDHDDVVQGVQSASEDDEE